MKRALMYASVASMIQQFNMENIRILMEQGYEVDVACNMAQGSTVSKEKIEAMKQELESMGVAVYHIPIPRKVSAIGEIMKSFCATIRLLNKKNYSLIHCHSPIGGMVCRVANRFSKRYRKTKMIYTAHGFHFYKGAPKKNWLMFYPVEWFCSRYTDVLITINQEDYKLACEKMCAKRVEYVPGVGIDINKFADVAVDEEKKREEIGVPEGSILLLSVGELNENKNHSTVIRALAQLKCDNVHYAIAGRGELEQTLVELSKTLGVEKQIHLLGYRTDVAALYHIADIYMHPSFREGLPVSVMEAMASGRAVICSNIRGNVDLINEYGGELFSPESVEQCKCAVQKLLIMDTKPLGLNNAVKIAEFSIDNVSRQIKELYCR